MEELVKFIATLWWVWLAMTIVFGWYGTSTQKSGDTHRGRFGEQIIIANKVTSVNLGWMGRATAVLFILSVILKIAGF